MHEQDAGEARASVWTLASLIEALDPEVREAIGDVDRSLIHLSLQQSPWERLRSASRMARALMRLRHGTSSSSSG
jgi:hypothetical protein